MVEHEKSDVRQFRGFETLGDIRTSRTDTQKSWRRLSLGFLGAGLIISAMLPLSLEQEANGLSAGPVEDRIVQGLGWWYTQMEKWDIDLPAERTRQFVNDISVIDWQTVFCVLRSSGLADDHIQSVSNLFVNDENLHECE